MKKYKLIKKYPGSDSLGTEITGSKETMYSKGFGYRNYDWAHVETHPEYWEEVIEKDYEILSFKQDSDITDLWIKFTGGWSRNVKGYPGTMPYTLQDILKNDLYKIHSVKRLSDGEVFTVGDLIKTPYTDCTPIVGFRNPEGNKYFIEISTGFTRLSTIEKVKKQPIFLTHDGKDIFDGDTVWYVNKRDFYKSYFIASKTQSFFSDTMAYFLTREDAEDYIEKKEVLFTTEDGVEVRKGDMIHGIYKTTFTISNTVVGNNNGVCNLFVAIFSTRAAAENYLVQKSYSLSIEDFWEFVCWGGSNIAKSKRLKRLVKERLNLK